MIDHRGHPEGAPAAPKIPLWSYLRPDRQPAIAVLCLLLLLGLGQEVAEWHVLRLNQAACGKAWCTHDVEGERTTFKYGYGAELFPVRSYPGDAWLIPIHGAQLAALALLLAAFFASLRKSPRTGHTRTAAIALVLGVIVAIEFWSASNAYRLYLEQAEIETFEREVRTTPLRPLR